MERLVIIGNGIAGITTARHVRKRDDRPITVISSESAHFFSRTALMYIFMGHMTHENTKPYEDWFWAKNRIELVYDHVEKVDTEAKRLILREGEPIDYGDLVLALGSASNMFGWSGQDLDGVQGLYSLQDLALLEANSQGVAHAVIVGGGLIGVEMAEMLHTRGIHVTMLIREDHYWGNILRREEGELIGRHLAEHGIELRVGTELREILDDGSGHCRAVVTSAGDEIACGLVGLTAGVHPRTELVADTAIESGRGIVVNPYLETSVPGIYAAGDCAEIREEGDARGRVEQLWYTGRMQGEALAATLCGERTRYDRGVWFNSAKFFDIEYQTYGQVLLEDREGETSLYWEHPSGKICIRFVYREADGVLVGMNAFGIRYRHLVFDRWLREDRNLHHVLTHLREANFDPEFFREMEPAIIDAYNRAGTGEPIALAKKKRFRLFA